MSPKGLLCVEQFWSLTTNGASLIDRTSLNPFSSFWLNLNVCIWQSIRSDLIFLNLTDVNRWGCRYLCNYWTKLLIPFSGSSHGCAVRTARTELPAADNRRSSLTCSIGSGRAGRHSPVNPMIDNRQLPDTYLLFASFYPCIVLSSEHLKSLGV